MASKKHIQFGELLIGAQFTRSSEDGLWQKTAQVDPEEPLESPENWRRSIVSPNCINDENGRSAYLFYQTLVLPVT